jgi:hypothetical protein
MENSISTKPRVITVRKANYFVLLLPIGFLVFSIWALISMSTPEYGSQIQETKTVSTNSSLVRVGFYGLYGVLILGAVGRSAYRNKRLSVENVSAIAWVASFIIVEVGNYLQLRSGHWSDFLGIILLDIPVILVIITLLQDKPFGGYSMYQNKNLMCNSFRR